VSWLDSLHRPNCGDLTLDWTDVLRSGERAALITIRSTSLTMASSSKESAMSSFASQRWSVRPTSFLAAALKAKSDHSKA
jgi:hypothetical protein